jgi:hypothetical protein
MGCDWWGKEWVCMQLISACDQGQGKWVFAGKLMKLTKGALLYVLREFIDEAENECSNFPLNWEVIQYGVRVILRGMVADVTIGREEAQGVVVDILRVILGKA